MDTLDPAILRRFQFRVEFLPMRFEQSVEAFNAAFLRMPEIEERLQLRELAGLVPADFANVARQLKFFADGGNKHATKLLKAELKARRGAPVRPIGFISDE